jgi:hypothetical protein
VGEDSSSVMLLLGGKTADARDGGADEPLHDRGLLSLMRAHEVQRNKFRLKKKK